MEAIVLAGGYGTRLKDVVPNVPKPMAKIGGRPFLEILLRSLESKGFERVILSLGYLAEIVIQHFGPRFGSIDICYEVEKKPLGTGGALRASLRNCIGEHVFVFNGDTFLDLEVDRVEALWIGNQNPVIVARPVRDISRYSQLSIQGSRIINFMQKGGSGCGLINAGCYVLPKHFLDHYEVGFPFSLEEDFLPCYVQSNPVELFVSDGYFIDIGIPEDYWRAQIELNHF